MQEIADLAGINKAMLHYYFKTKEQLFNKVFERALHAYVGKIITLLNTSESLQQKVFNYIEHTIESLKKNPGITIFVIQELNVNPERVSELFLEKGDAYFANFKKQVSNEFDGKIDPDMFFMDMVALCVYPFIAQSIFKRLMGKNDASFLKLMQQRKDWVMRLLFKKN